MGSDVDGVVEIEIWPTRWLEAKVDEANGINENTNTNVALIILHSPIKDIDYFRKLWSHASFRLCADGAANNIHDLLTSAYDCFVADDNLRAALPDVIHGDLDSIDPAVRKQYERLGVEISQDTDQYSTDFEKAVKKVVERLPDVQDVLVLGSLGGRVDHGIGLLSDLYREQKSRHAGIRFWLLSESSVSTILSPGTTIVHTPLESGLITRNIGILSVYGPASITTQGLEWDVQDWPTEMGGQMSTSNHIVADSVKITTDNHVLFTVEAAAGG